MYGEKIKELRTKTGKTQEDVAKYLGVAPQTVYKYEKEINEPDTTTLSKLADYFNVSVDEILGRTINEPIPIAASMKNGLDISDMGENDKKVIMDLYNLLKSKNKGKSE